MCGTGFQPVFSRAGSWCTAARSALFNGLIGVDAPARPFVPRAMIPPSSRPSLKCADSVAGAIFRFLEGLTLSDDVLPAHGLAEAYFYLMVTPCPSCGQGPLEGSDARRVEDADGSALVVEIGSTCGTCHLTRGYTFRLPDGTGIERGTGLACVNPTVEPSRIIDVGQWLTLFRVIVERAGRTRDKPEARRLGLEAAQCLEEALKFYEDDNDLPPPSAAFTDPSKRHLAQRPDSFSRQRLIELRAKLPRTEVMRQRSARDALSRKPRRRWWRR